MNSSPNTDRSRLARELHDGLAQELAAIGYEIDSLIGYESLDQIPRNQLRSLRVNLSALIEQVRFEIHALRNDSPQSFAELLKSQCDALLKGSKISIDIAGEAKVDSEINYELLRCLRELIINSVKHSGCQKINITLSDSLITYSDDGVFKTTVNNMNFGLNGLRERVENFGGELIQSNSNFKIKLP